MTEKLEIRQIGSTDIPQLAKLMKNYADDGEYTLRLLLENRDNHLWKCRSQRKWRIRRQLSGYPIPFPRRQ